MAHPVPPAGVAVPGAAVDASEGLIVKIRKFEQKDIKEVRLLLGYSTMEQLALANTLLYTNPFVIAAWLGLSSVMVTLMKWWPVVNGPLWTWLMPLPALASCAVPILFVIDWLNRAVFEHLTRLSLSREDTLDITSYYNNPSSPGTAFWVLIYKNNPIGVAATDAFKPTEELRGLDDILKEAEAEVEKEHGKGPAKKPAKTKAEKEAQKEEHDKREAETREKVQNKIASLSTASKPKQSSNCVYVRHFHLDAPYRATFIQNDLFAHALAHAFTSEAGVEKAYLRISRLTPWLAEVSRTMGMQKCAGPEGSIDLEKDSIGRGPQRWKEYWVGVGRKDWEKRFEEIRELHGL
ncbi:hypothetical protein DACRYDRAFT_25297 [Dacryopinax primogenitus]|uniref:Uncharacterized protein n=1 Tax=Dacryopinax primogenitus (strain DJM 731) TaxID=1858805 RepID=M5FNC1_DACPD|nr:uncharacterized protein DACRYDRAFT_25297 [Dacryopinax primogenitus]EJT97185.1 hypothetical protein DACRYDRAFT_25297 [Dacryopinax primogenitus]